MKEKNKQKRPLSKYVVYVFFTVLVVFFVGLKLAGRLPLDGRRLNIESSLTTESEKAIEDFVSLSLKDEFIPKEIKLEEMPADATSEASLITEHFASWEIGEEIFSLLYVIKKGEKKPDFIRLWTINIDDGVTQEKSADLLKFYFKESYIRMFENISCVEIEGMKTSEKAVECGQMKIVKPADLLGAVVKGSVFVSEGFFGQSVSVCLIPDGVLRGYPFKNCI